MGATVFLEGESALKIFNSNTNRIQTVFEERHGLPDMVTSTALYDRDGGLWIGTETGLLHHIVQLAEQPQTRTNSTSRRGVKAAWFPQKQVNPKRKERPSR